MKLNIPCMECFKENSASLEKMYLEEFSDNGTYEITCDSGHKTVTQLQNEKFEVLFNMSVMALYDGYPREAVATMASALERFYEFYIKSICFKLGVTDQALAESWKHVAAQSERQYGGFIFAYLLDNKGHQGRLPPTIHNVKPVIPGKSKGKSQSWSQFRNSVVHKGFIPSRNLAIAYGDLVYNHVMELLADLNSRDDKCTLSAHFSYRNNHLAEIGVDNAVTYCLPTLMDWQVRQKGVCSIEDALERVPELKRHYRS